LDGRRECGDAEDAGECGEGGGQGWSGVGQPVADGFPGKSRFQHLLRDMRVECVEEADVL